MCGQGQRTLPVVGKTPPRAADGFVQYDFIDGGSEPSVALAEHAPSVGGRPAALRPAHPSHYVHYNPVKHGHVNRAAQWPHSSIHRHIAEGALGCDRGGQTNGRDESGYGER